MSQLKSVEQAKYVVDHRVELAQKAKENGRTIMGYYCCLSIRELITAVGAYPFRIVGNAHDTPSEVDRVLETTMCPFIRSTVDLALKGEYDFLDGLIIPHSCECMERMIDIWPFYIEEVKNVFMLDIPHMVYTEDSFDFFSETMRALARSINEDMGLEITPDNLRAAIKLHNENRRLLQELYTLREADVPPISAEDVYYFVHAGNFMDVQDHSSLLKQALEEAKHTNRPEAAGRPRILLHMAQMDDPGLLMIIDECGGEVVADDMCIGSRAFNFQADEEMEPFCALAHAYLSDIHCPRTCRVDEPNNRFNRVIDIAKSANATGAILFVTRYCDTHAYDVPQLRKALEDAGLSVLHMEEEYNIGSSKGQIKTRIQAFVEML